MLHRNIRSFQNKFDSFFDLLMTLNPNLCMHVCVFLCVCLGVFVCLGGEVILVALLVVLHILNNSDTIKALNVTYCSIQ